MTVYEKKHITEIKKKFLIWHEKRVSDCNKIYDLQYYELVEEIFKCLENAENWSDKLLRRSDGLTLRFEQLKQDIFANEHNYSKEHAREHISQSFKIFELKRKVAELEEQLKKQECE